MSSLIAVDNTEGQIYIYIHKVLTHNRSSFNCYALHTEHAVLSCII